MPLPEEDLFSISEIYHENTKDRKRVAPIMSKIPQQQWIWYRAFKKYPHKPRVTMEVPAPSASPGLEEVIQRRRTIREFSGESLSLEELARLLYFSNGITAKVRSGDIELPLRASPSAGALYPIELYPVVFSVTGLEEGVYHYNVEDHVLEFLRPGDYREALYEASHRQEMLLLSSVLIVMTAIFGRTKIKYGERGYRYVLLDAGHLAQNLYLESTAQGLGCATIGGFLDDEVNGLLGVDGLLESAVYMAVIGKVLGNSRGTAPQG
ncbi:MAG: SagB/ThcOx family dehydrogenase [Candidatus Fermentithermobacillus carboniphilus]|uniref:SagB/ThcOx family dehydrogenase n=1 Tax=Candidatus Fermentithermobacillus carboniphilus TaxID=3085328 RepID=A0AAT9LFI5_9FIRM|nr:MAG: SagB/ThcOx family dehydrogenase [Candidatus Fermentithermobacillus carboniphilus]